MKPSSFEYARPESLSEALDLLSSNGDNASILAGGQSLVPTLNMRLSSPSLIVDINEIKELEGISINGDLIRIGAMTRQKTIENSLEIAEHTPLLTMAMPHIAHPAIRNRGTIGGSVALADPAAELPACLCALGADFDIAGPNGTRKISSNEFFKGLYQTDLKDNELLTAINIPKLLKGYRSGFDELSRRHGDYAMAGLALHAKLNGRIVDDLRMVFFAISGTPVLANAAGDVANGKELTDDIILSVQSALEGELEPFDSLDCSAKTKMLYAKELAGRELRLLIK